MASQLRATLFFCILAILLSFAIVALAIKVTLVLGGSDGLRRVLRQRHCPPPLIKRHVAKSQIPAIGGIWLLTAQSAVFFLLMDRSNLTSWILLLAALGFGAAGAFDDLAKLRQRTARGERTNSAIGDVSARTKFILQLLLTLFLLLPLTSMRFHRGLAGVMQTETPAQSTERTLSEQSLISADQNEARPDLSDICSKFYLPFQRQAVWQAFGWQRGLALLFFAFVIIGSSNAVNLTDGLDGLAAGCAICTSTALIAAAFVIGDRELATAFCLPHIAEAAQVAIYLCGLLGGLLGFLLFNKHPARIFMGDVGSLSLGAVLGFAALLIRQEWLLACAGGVLVIETLSVILQVASYKWRRGKRLFLCTPLHHHFECLGWTEKKIVRSFWTASLLFTSIALSLMLLWPR